MFRPARGRPRRTQVCGELAVEARVAAPADRPGRLLVDEHRSAARATALLELLQIGLHLHDRNDRTRRNRRVRRKGWTVPSKELGLGRARDVRAGRPTRATAVRWLPSATTLFRRLAVTRPSRLVVALGRDLFVDLVCATHSGVHRVPMTRDLARARPVVRAASSSRAFTLSTSAKRSSWPRIFSASSLNSWATIS